MVCVCGRGLEGVGGGVGGRGRGGVVVCVWVGGEGGGSLVRTRPGNEVTPSIYLGTVCPGTEKIGPPMVALSLQTRLPIHCASPKQCP